MSRSKRSSRRGGFRSVAGLVSGLIASWVLWMAPGCAESTPGGGGTTDLSTFSVPTEISAVPTSGTSSTVMGLRTALMGIAPAATDSGTDYSEAQTERYVEEHALRQFDNLENVLDAINQTRYFDMIGEGPYVAMVAFQEEEEGINRKNLQRWVVQSDAIDASGNVVDAASCSDCRLRAWCWIDEGTHITKGEFIVSSPPVMNADGSYADYGEWSVYAKFEETGETDYFAATCRTGDSGEVILALHERFSGFGPPGSSEGGVTNEVRAIMYRSDSEGYGKVEYPDWDAVFGPDADPESLTEMPTRTATYAYNAEYLAVQDGESEVAYKDRSTEVEMVHRYGAFHAETGEDVMKSRSFGFPIRYAADGGVRRHAYYGAYQGRHEIWSGDSLTAGTTVTRDDVPPDQVAPTYTVGERFVGTLTRRTLVDASLSDIQDIPVELWLHRNYNLRWSSGESKWYYCPRMDWEADPPECAETPVDFDAEIGLASLAVGANDDRKHVHISGWNPETEQEAVYVYELASSANGQQAGFYLAQWSEGEHGMVATVVSPRQAIDTEQVDQLFVSVSGSIYVEYQGEETGWVEKELASFDTRTWTPTFATEGDKPFTLPDGMELYMNMQGANYVVRRSDETVSVHQELQSVAHPGNATTMVPEGTVLRDQFQPDGASTYEFVTDPESPKYLLLVYRTLGDDVKDFDAEGNATVQDGIEVGGIVERDLWGLGATIDEETIQFNWEHSSDGGWGSVAYLLDSEGDYVILDDPIRFDPITATNLGGVEKTLSLQFDGWMMGLPDMYPELEEAGWTMTEEIQDKIVNLPTGTQVTDSATDTAYLLKPLEISVFLAAVADTTGLTLPDVTQGDTIDLATAPDYVDGGIGDMPEDAELLFSEGNPVGD